MGFYIVSISVEFRSNRWEQGTHKMKWIVLFFPFRSRCRAKSLRTPSNVFVVNLAFCDFMMMTKTPIFIYNSFNRGYELGILGCQVFAFMGSLSGIGAAITNACIAYDRWEIFIKLICNPHAIFSEGGVESLFWHSSRYNVITNPLEGKLSMPKALFMVLLIWSYTIPWAVFPLLELWGRFVPGGFVCLFCHFNPKTPYISIVLFTTFNIYHLFSN